MRASASGSLTLTVWAVVVLDEPGSGITRARLARAGSPTGPTNVEYRLEPASARAFLGQYVTLP